MLKVISTLLLVAQTLFPTARPGVDRTDAYARAAGNDKPLAVMVGNRLFKTEWPAQVLSVYADLADNSDVVGLRVAGKHFHGKLTANTLADEVTSLVSQTFSIDPRVEEVDVWVTVPLDLGKDIVVKSDVNTPSWKTVFSVSVRRGESGLALRKRLAAGRGVYFDQEWKHSVVK